MRAARASRYRVGDEIKLGETEFTRLADAFFTEIERKYPSPGDRVLQPAPPPTIAL